MDDEATVPVYYESRLIPVNLPEGVDPELIDERADEATAGLDDSERERIQQAVAVMNALYGAPDRVRVLAADLVEHWEARSEQMRKFIGGPGKGIIVCATRQICADLYGQIIALKPDWHDDDIAKGKIKVVYTGGPDDPESDPQARPAAVAQQADPAPDEGHRRRPGTGHRPVDVAHRVRLTAAAHPLPGPADARCRADAGAGPGQPHVPRQAGRAAGRVRPADREPVRGARRVHRHRSADQAPGPGHRRGHV